MHIRRAGPKDAEEILEIANAGWRWAYAHIIPAEELATLENPERTARVANSLANGHCTFVAESDGRIIGFSSIEDPCHVEMADFEIGGLYVRPDCSRRGLGKSLVAVSAHEGIARGRSKLAIHTLRDNPIGIRFYERIGGRVVCEGDWAFRGVKYPTVWYLFEDLQELARIAPI